MHWCNTQLLQGLRCICGFCSYRLQFQTTEVSNGKGVWDLQSCCDLPCCWKDTETLESCARKRLILLFL